MQTKNVDETGRAALAGHASGALHWTAAGAAISMLPTNVLGIYDRFIAPVSISHAFPWEVWLWVGGLLLAAGWVTGWMVVAVRKWAAPDKQTAFEAIVLAALVVYPMAMMATVR
jgi:hypothetical protein